MPPFPPPPPTVEVLVVAGEAHGVARLPALLQPEVLYVDEGVAGGVVGVAAVRSPRRLPSS